MKALIVSLFFLCLGSASFAQGLQNWFSQKTSEKKYLVQQIAALQTYIAYAQKGYSIAKGGLDNIKEIKQSHLDIDTLFISGFNNVNSEVRQHAQKCGLVDAINTVRLEINRIKKVLAGSALINKSESVYLHNILEGVQNRCDQSVYNLVLVLTPYKLRMSDAQRLRWIDALYDETQRVRVFISSMYNEVVFHTVNRKNESDEIRSLQQVLGK